MNGIKSDEEIFNKLVDKTTEIMKVEIIQAITGKDEPRRDRRTLDRRFKYSKSQKDVELGLVGDLVKQRFSSKSIEIKNEIMNDLKEVRNLSSNTLNIRQSSLNMFDESKIIKENTLRQEYSFLNEIKEFEKLVSLQVNSEGKIVLDKDFAKIASSKLALDGIVALDKEFEQLNITRVVSNSNISLDKEKATSVDTRIISPTMKSISASKANLIKPISHIDYNVFKKFTIPVIKPLVLREVKNVKLNLHSVKCIDETGSSFQEKFGDDEIAVGGITIDDKAKEDIIREFKIDKKFSDGVERRYSPPQNLKTFTRLDSSYPKLFSSFITIAEKDWGGFSKFINDLYQAIKKELDIILTGLGAIVGAKIGGSLGTLAGPIGTIIGAAAGAILGALIGWLVKSLRDDIFTPQATVLSIPAKYSYSSSVNKEEVINTPIETLRYREHKGDYQVRVSWTIVY